MHGLTTICWLLIGCVFASSQSSAQGDRWVWRRVRSPSTALELPFNPFEPFLSSADEARAASPQAESGSPRIAFSSTGPETLEAINQRGNVAVPLSSIPADNPAIAVPISISNPETSGRNRNPISSVDPQRVVQKSLGIAHFTIPRQLGRPVTVTTPTSNHLTIDNEPLVSSYSSLDAEVSGFRGFQNSGNRNEERALVNPAVRNGLITIPIRPLPIDISQLPLESNERAEGIKKLWSSLTSRTEFAQIFETLAGTRNNNTTSRNRDQVHDSETENSSILLDPHNSISESLIRVINPPQIQLQQQILKQQLHQQQLQERLQQRLQDQFEAAIQQQELKKHLEIKKLIREREEQQRIAIQQKVAEEQQRIQQRVQRVLLQQQQKLQEQQLQEKQKILQQQQGPPLNQPAVHLEADASRISTQTPGPLSVETQNAGAEVDETLSSATQNAGTHSTSSQSGTKPEDIIRQRHLELVARLQRQKTPKTDKEINRTNSQLLELRRRLQEQAQRQQLQEQRQRPAQRTTAISTTDPSPETVSTSSEVSLNAVSAERLSIVFPPRLPSPSRLLALPDPQVSSPSITITTNNTTITNNTNTITTTTNNNISGVGQLLQATVRFPQREGSFVVRKIRLPGNYIVNVVFVPDERTTLPPSATRPDISESPSALRLFQSQEVQQNVRALKDKNAVLVVEELVRDGKNLYLINTMEGERVYPKEPKKQTDEVEGNVWAAFVGVFSDETKKNSSRNSSNRDGIPTINNSSNTAGISAESLTPIIRDTRTPLAKVGFSQVEPQNLSERLITGNEFRNFQAPHAFLVKFTGREDYNPYPSLDSSGTPQERFNLVNQPVQRLPSSSVSTRFFNPFHEPVSKSVSKSLQIENHEESASLELQIPVEPRGLESTHSRWPWPDEVPESLDDFFDGGPSNFRTTRSLR
ncbi:transcription activator MSS11-like [Hyalella azteca]|uniref:Transcription activator MSS11-like n=1 Tax=Hyalella azteca TaxID=294128 RepID=A0A8B7NK66_HYAAZ|nr:transcription activator MSS11-like [Hyalella azteca]